MKLLQNIHPFFYVLAATVFEVFGDALVRKCLHEYTGVSRIVFFILGAALLFLYGSTLNLAPVEFGQVVGLYIATLFVVWQIGNYIAYKNLPTIPVIIGGTLVIVGGLIITFWKAD